MSSTRSQETAPAAQAELPSNDAVADWVGQALDMAQRKGATAAEADAGVADGLTVGVRLGEVESLQYQRDRRLAVTVLCGQRTGSATTSDLRREGIESAVDAACRIARHAADDPYAGLADPALMARELPDLDLDHPWGVTADEAIERARECETVARADARITNSEGAELESHAGVSAYGNTHGFMGAERATRHGLGCAVVAGHSDHMQRDFWYTVARAQNELESAEAVGRRARERTIARIGAEQMATTTCPVLFTPEMARSLVGHLVSAVSGAALYRNASFLVGARGEQLFPAFVHLREQPHEPRAMGSAAFDREGVATAPRDLVRGGVLEGYVLDSYAARRLDLATTGNAGGVHNLTLAPGEAGFDELVARMGRGLIVTEMMGMGVNTVTGDYSRGAAGYWVENGAIVRPVQEITIAGHLRRMFAGIQAVGADLDKRSSIRTPSVLIDELTIAGA
jgi:PmbA protein